MCLSVSYKPAVVSVDFELVREHCKGKKAHKAHGCTPAKAKKAKHHIAKPINSKASVKK